MLKVYIDTIPDEKNIIRDIEKHFDTIRLKGSDLDKLLIKEIDNGEYYDETSFIDRFGCKLYTTELSTGCKAALCVANTSDKVVDLIECGLNARDAIICACKQGTIVMHNESVTIQDRFHKPIDIEIDQYRIISIDRLNKYIQCERPYKPQEGSEIVCLK